jgi:hypothetical protein
MLLALVLVFMGTQPGDPDAGAAPPTTTSTSTTTTVPPTTTTTTPPGVDQEYICIRVQTDQGQLGSASAPGPAAYLDSLAEQVRAQLRAKAADGRQAGVVLSFGVGATPGPGRAAAEAFNAHVLSRVPEVFEGAALRGFWDGTPGAFSSGSVMLNVYPFTDADHPAAAPGSSAEC